MKTIILLAVAASLLFDFFGTKSSVGGPMTDLLIAFVTVLAVGIYEAVSNDRGPFGWLVNIVVALVGGFVGVALFGTFIETIMTLFHFEGQLATSDHPLRYIASAGMPIFTILGSWLPLRLLNFIPARSRVAAVNLPDSTSH